MSRSITQIALPRSGSTLVDQVIKQLMPKTKVRKIHSFDSTDDFVIITYRDFRDVLVSRWRVRKDLALESLDAGRQITKEEMEEIVNLFNEEITYLNKAKAQYPDALLLQYERFYNDFDYLFEKLEEFFGLQFSPGQRQAAQLNSSMKKNKERASKFSSFHNENWDAHGIHGLHVYKGTPGTWRQLIPVSLHHSFNDYLKSQLKNWGYEA